MSMIEAQLDNLDEQLAAYTPQQRLLISIGSALAILILGWMLYLTDAIDELNVLEEQNNVLMQQISENSPDAYHTKIKIAIKSLDKEKIHTAELDADKQAIIDQMSASKGLIFDNKHYARMLDLLLEKSVNLGLKIELMESVDTDEPYFGKVNKYKKLTIKGIGKFPAIAEFVTFIESQNALVQMDTLRVETDEEKPHFEAVILYMGVAL
ncbi:MAG: hypothetical protein WCW84_02870 [Sulfurimonas sp.]|jgi:Tfp pilus assembly protein PilO